METIFIQLAIILLVAFIISYVVKLLNQPVIVGYILAGIFVSPILFKLGVSTEIISTFSNFGISFLLFIVGLHLNPKVIKEIGVSSIAIGLLQIILTFGAGFIVSKYLLSFTTLTSVYIGIAISFSSTIVIMKLLSDEKQIDSLYGKISIGILILQDLVAIIILMIISSSPNQMAIEGGAGIHKIILGGLLIALLFLFGYKVLPKFIKHIAKSQEILFLFSISLCFGLAALFSYIGFSMEIGSLLAGVILSTSPYATEISSKVRPLRDFFLIIFFIMLGTEIQIYNIKTILVPAIILSLVTLILKPIITMGIMRFFGYTKRTNFLVGSTLGQISEFSLIVLGIGIGFNQISPEIMDIMILTMIITILFSSYLITYGSKFYKIFAPVLKIFEKKKIKKERKIRGEYDTILFGYNRIGFSILNALKKMNRKYLIVDFNPDIINKLEKFGIPALYGDVDDIELLNELPLKNLDLVISTIPDVEANELLIQSIRQVNKNATIILRAHTIGDALKLYEIGANYVLTPHFLGGEYVAKMIKHSKLKEENYSEEKKKHIKLLNEILGQGKEHPEVERG